MVRIWRAGDQLSVNLLASAHRAAGCLDRDGDRIYALFRTSRQMRPSLSTLGWNILVRKRILGGVMG